MQTLAIIGAGKLGIVLSQLALKAGYRVLISGSGSVDKIALSVQVLAPGAQACTTAEAAAKADIVILALPLSKYPQIPPSLLDGKLVVDAMNYWWEVDGEREESQVSTSEQVQAYFSNARVVKALSHMGYHHLLDEANTHGERKAIAIAGDSATDVATVSQLITNIGFDPLPIGSLGAGKNLEPGHAAFGANVNASKLTALVDL